jgi:hypothetical protein
MRTAILTKFFSVLMVPVLVLIILQGEATAQVQSELPDSMLMLENGQTLLQSGQVNAAELLFYDAFQISRANSGFYSPQQIAILENILASSLLLGKWDQFLQRAEYLERLYAQLYGLNSAQMIEGWQKLSYWHLAAAAAMDSERTVWHLIKSRTLLWQAVSQIEARSGKNDPALAPLLYQIALRHYYFANSTQRRGITSYELRSDSPAFISGWSQSKNATLKRDYEVGVELLQRIRGIYANSNHADAETDAMMLLYFADWQLLFGRGGEALENYYEAWDMLSAAGFTEEQLDRYFGRPMLLPITSLNTLISAGENSELNTLTFSYWSSVLPGVQAPTEHPFTLLIDAHDSISKARASIDLQPSGFNSEARGRSGNSSFDYHVTNISWTEQPLNSVLAQAESNISLLKFRPVLITGEVVSAKDITLDYMTVGPESL